jgi:hypothetical protein
MDKKKVLAGVLILILLMLLFRSSKNYKTATASKTTITTKTNVVNNHPYYHPSVKNNIRYKTFNPYKAQYYN